MSLFSELKRRNTFRVAAAYVVVAWLLLQVSDVLAPALRLPEWFQSGVTFVLLLGFPVALVLSWAFEVTPEGIRRDTGDPEDGAANAGHWSNTALAVALVAIIGFIAWDRWSDSGGNTAESMVGGDATAVTNPAPAEPGAAAGEFAPSPTIAVLPFADMSPEGDQEYMGDGIAEEMLNLLAKIPELRVISRSSAFSFKGANADIPTIAARLGASHVLEGSVRTAGNQVRITAQLIEAGSDIHLWSETYDRQLDNIFAIQDEIALAVVEALRVRLVGPAPTTVAVNTEAYDLALKARFHWLRRGPGDEQEALRLYERSVAIDPSYGPAWTGLSVALAVAALKGRIDRETGLERANEAAYRGVELSPESAEAYVRLGQARARGGDYAGQQAAYDRALELDPNNALALGVSAMVAWRNIQPERTVELYRRAEAADPMSSVMPANLSGHLTNLGRFEEAEAAIERARAIVGEPGALAPHEATLALVQGEYERTLDLAVSVENTPERLQLIAMAHHGLGHSDAAQAQLDRWLASEPAPSGFEQAGVLAFMGRVDEAFALLEQDEQIELRGGFLVLDALFKNLHGDPRWVDIVTRLEAAAAARID